MPAGGVATTVPPMDDRQRVSSGSPWELTVGYSRALRVGDRVFVAAYGPDRTGEVARIEADKSLRQVRACTPVFVRMMVGSR